MCLARVNNIAVIVTIHILRGRNVWVALETCVRVDVESRIYFILSCSVWISE